MSPEAPAPPFMVAPFRLDSLHEPVAPVPPGPEHGRHSAPSHQRRRRGRRAFLLALLLLVVAVGAFVGVRLRASEPAPAVTPALTRTVHVPARTVALPWPTSGQGAIAVPSIGINVASGAEKAAPVASLTKLMTAYVVLHDSTIDGIATARPRTLSQLRDIPGIGDKKLEHYGEELIALVNASRAEA